MSRARLRSAALALALALAATPAAASRVRVFSLQGLDGGDRGDQLAAAARYLNGVEAARFDLYASEMRVQFADGVPDARFTGWIAKVSPGVRALPGAGRGRYAPQIGYPAGTDVVLVTRDGSPVGPLEKLRVPGKTTIVDVYADWCIACRPMDERIREYARTHRGVAVRKLNLARWDSPLARELGSRLTALPHVIVFTPDGRRHEFDGEPWERIAATLRLR